jgi:hypothetical protein
MFGYPADIENPKAYWGARAIKEGSGFSLLPDRQNYTGIEVAKNGKAPLLTWVNKMLPKARKWAGGQSSSSKEVFTITEGKFTLKASCNASYGYVYIGAWEDENWWKKSQYEGKDRNGNRYALQVPPEGKWSGTIPVPAIGDKVAINFNELGTGRVCAYFLEAGYVGVEVVLDNQPEWHREQNGEMSNALVFGIEISPREAYAKA